VWPKDVELRRNIVSSALSDIPAMVAARDAIVLDNNEEPVPLQQFEELLQQTNMSAAVHGLCSMRL
jgi:hypothetical protein